MSEPRAADPAPQWVSRVTVGATVVVAAVAATVSYVHVFTLASRAGEQWRAWLTPLSVDGLLVAASMVLLVRRRAGLRAGWLPWFGLLLGLGASLGANVSASHPEWRSPWLDGAIAAWPAAALAVSFELLVLIARDRRLVSPSPPARPVSRDDQQEPDSDSQDVPVGVPAPTQALAVGEPAPGDGEADRAAALIADGAGRRRLSRELGLTEHQARELLAGRRNGTGG